MKYLKFVLPLIMLALVFSCDQSNKKSDSKTTEATSEAKMTTIKAEVREDYSAYAGDNFPKDVYFGDTHLHTSWSTDAGMVGNNLGPESAYILARGGEITSSFGLKLPRPLDFLVVSDHAENLGLAPAIVKSDPVLFKSAWGKKIHDAVKANKPTEAFDMWIKQVNLQEDKLAGTGLAESYWKATNGIAEKYNEPGLFTAFIGFEWTSMPNGNNLHRNVIFRDNMDKTSQVIPISSYDTQDPEELWEYLDAYEKKTGGQVLAIAHNGNISNGLMFDDITLTSKEPIDKAYAETRMKWEPIYEVTQIKGDGETHPSLSPNDEFADFYTWDTGTLGPESTTPDMFPRSYAREALKRGLVYEEKLGANPFKFGMIGSTDSHTSIMSTEENNFFGKVSLTEPNMKKFRFDEEIIARTNPDEEAKIYHWEAAASGLAAVWAKENTREALWDAMKRKEVYATTGSRLKVRVFGGWDYTASDLDRPKFAKYGYQNGVPMGGDLTDAAAGKAPSFLIKALRDVDGANIDRVQIIKGWVDAEGEKQEQVVDLAVSDGRVIAADGRCKTAVGSTVNTDEATFDNSIGEPTMEAFWVDPDFDPAQRAFYYVRVIEIPTPSWVAYDIKSLGMEMPEDATDDVLSVQDRAYTSPIWYTPN
jgi:hypothetical protein